jgi:hypothetical protein
MNDGGFAASEFVMSAPTPVLQVTVPNDAVRDRGRFVGTQDLSDKDPRAVRVR